MTIFVESLKRLFQKKDVGASKLEQMLKSGTISQEEYDFITGKEGSYGIHGTYPG